MTSCTLLFSLRIDYDRWSAGTQEADKNACAVRDTIHGQFKPLTALSKNSISLFWQSVAIRPHENCNVHAKTSGTALKRLQTNNLQHENSIRKGASLFLQIRIMPKWQGKPAFRAQPCLSWQSVRFAVSSIGMPGAKTEIAEVKKEPAWKPKIGFPPGNQAG